LHCTTRPSCCSAPGVFHTPFSILAIEEVGKRALVLSIFLGDETGVSSWDGYRRHTVKTSGLNQILVALAMAYFPDLEPEVLAQVAVGPSPAALEAEKQLSLYSDCLEATGSPAWHLPGNIDWETGAKERLAEAASLVLSCRDQTPEELDLWAKHLRGVPRSDELAMSRAVAELNAELREKGFLVPGRADILVNLGSRIV
jgi:AbiV family abortive infection protein